MANFEHDQHCKSIADELEKYASGDYFMWDGELYPFAGDDAFWSEEGNGIESDAEGYEYYIIGGERVAADDIEEATLYNYFDDIYNTNYILDSNKELEAVRVMVACGGPNIYINTWDKKVELFWWTERGEAWLSNEICDAINDYFREFWDC